MAVSSHHSNDPPAALPIPDSPFQMPSDLDRYLVEHDRRIHDELFDLLRIPSVSARSEHTGDVRRAGEWVRDSLTRIGFEASLHETPGHPIVLAEWRKAPGAPTIVVYG